MKILHLIENLDDSYGGPAKSVPYLCKYLNDINVDTEMLSIKYKENEINTLINLYHLNWKSFNYNFIKKSRYSFELKEYLNEIFLHKQNNYNNYILHVHNLWNYIPLLAYNMHKKFHIPFIISVRGSLYEWSLSQSKLQKKIAWFLFQKNILKKASCIHVTEINELKAVRNLGITTPIVLIPNGINIEEFKQIKNKMEAKKILNLNIDKKYILFMSRLHPKKGLEYLINSWITLSKEYKNWDLLIVGPEYDKKYIKNIKYKIKKAGLENRVIFTGLIKGKERIDYFAASNLFVLPSHSENFGIVIAEAMAAKLPVITTQGTPWKEIETYNAGWWVKLNQKNIDAVLKEALMCGEKELREKGIKGFDLIKKYDWKYQAQKMKKVYDWILGYSNKPEFVYEFGDEK